MATAITMPAVNGTAAAVGANGASNAEGSHGTPDAHRLHHKDNAIEHWTKIETLLAEKQASFGYEVNVSSAHVVPESVCPLLHLHLCQSRLV